MRGTLISKDLTDDELLTVVRSVKFMGERVLLAFTRELAFENNVRALEAMEKEGIFQVNLTTAVRKSVLNPSFLSYTFDGALPLIDALAGVLDKSSLVIASEPSFINLNSSVSGSYPLVECSEDMRVFLRRVCSQSLRELKRWAPEVAKDVFDESAVIKKHEFTAAAVCAIGFAVDDPELVRIATDSDPGCMYRTDLNFRNFPWNRLKDHGNELKRVSISPLGLGVYMQAVNCFRSINFSSDHPLSDQAVWQGEFDSDRLGVFGLIAENPHFLKPEFIGAALAVSYEAFSKPPKTNASGVQSYIDSRNRMWLKDRFLPELVGGEFSYLLPTVMRDVPGLFRLDMKNSCTNACWYAFPSLIEHLAEFISTPRLSSASQTAKSEGKVNDAKPDLACIDADEELARVLGDWFLPFHPINQIIDTTTTGGTAQQDPDGALVEVLKIMSDRGILGDINIARQNNRRGATFAHLCVTEGFNKTLVAMGEMGLSFSVRDSSGRTPKAYALDCGFDDLADLLSAIETRQEALSVLALSSGLSMGGRHVRNPQ